jgi:ABC-type dipeptide/oligopeptide/nickel transport system permease component
MLARSGATPEAVTALRNELGLDRPLHQQFGIWLVSLLRGDLGRSLFYGRPVTALIAEQFPYTLQLAIAAFALAVTLGFALGGVAARWPYGWIDRIASILAIGGLAVPVFWSGLLLILLFSERLGWLPPTGAESWQSLVMPALVLGYGAAGPIARLTRTTVLEVWRQPYITSARAKGLPEGLLLLRHALRNALIPLVTVSGLQLSFLLGGTVVTETVFGRPGLGRLLVDAILWRDLPVVQGVALLAAAAYVIINLGVDLISGWLNPQVSWQ